jgi:hypothetical protein
MCCKKPRLNDLTHYLFWAGCAGWLLLLVVLQLGGKQSGVTASLTTLIFLFVSIDIISILWGIAEPVLKKQVYGRPILGLGSICCFVALPYLLSGLRIYWLRRHSRRARLIASGN